MKHKHLVRGIALLLAGFVTMSHAAPFTPSSDAEIVQKLPARVDAATRLQRAALARNPQQLALALATARAAIERARASGDPRELGVAQAALAPWWKLAAPPSPVRLLRATVLQSQHRFDDAMTDLNALADDAGAALALQAQAGLTRVAVLQVTGRLDEAAKACDNLLSARFAALGAALSVPARACAAELRSLQGQPQSAARELAALAAEAPGDRWLMLLRAELAQRLGDDAGAQARFAELARADADVYVVAAHADWLLDAGRFRETLELLQSRDLDADALALRHAIALRALRDPRADAAAQALGARFDAARLRGEGLHVREEARFALDVLGDPARALALASENWKRQREPADALLLWRAAHVAGQPAAALPLREWAGDPARVDVRLAMRPEGARR